MHMKKTTTFVSCAAALVLAGCSSGAVTAPNVANVSASVLQFNVGTANIYGDAYGGAVPVHGLNVAVTYRQPAGGFNPGASATLVNTPTLTLPAGTTLPAAGTADGFGATILTGPAASEIATNILTSIPQTPAATNNVAATATFGDSGGAFGSGLEPFNYAGALGTAGVAGAPASVFPYPVPVFDATAADINQFFPGGGPPAFCPNGVANCNTAATNAGFNGVSEGLDVFELAAPAVLGTYTLSVAVPGNTGTVTASQSAAITSAALLPNWTVPTVPTVYTAASGAITFQVTLPAGVSEAYVQVTDIGPTTAGGVSCIGATAAAPVYYTIEATATGPYTVPAPGICSAAANTTATGSASDGDEFGVQSIGFDYPAYEASYPKSLGNPSPTLVGTGASHQADITVSTLTEYTMATNVPALVPAGSRVPLAVGRRSAGAILRR